MKKLLVLVLVLLSVCIALIVAENRPQRGVNSALEYVKSTGDGSDSLPYVTVSSVIGQDTVAYNTGKGVPISFTKQTSSSKTFFIQKGQLNHYRQRPAILNEHVESARQIQDTVKLDKIVGQIFKASQDNINGINLTLESAAALEFDNFESYADDAALQTVWVETDATDKAVLENTIVFTGSTQSMALPGDATLLDEWVRTITSTDYTSYTWNLRIYQDITYANLKIEFFIGDGTNTKHAPLVVQDPNGWETISVNSDAMTEDGGTTNTAAITKIGFRLVDRWNGSTVYIDDIFVAPPPGTIKAELWDMGDSLPVSGVTAIDDGTQYTELGDRGLNSGTVFPDVTVNLIGGKRIYRLDKFIAGTALEIPSNTLIDTGNYYALVLRYVDTDVLVYGVDTSFSKSYYDSGFAFTAPDTTTAITGLGQYSDIQFSIFSVQDVWINTFLKFYDAEPGKNATETVYIEDCNMQIENIIAGENTPQQSLLAEFKDRYFYFPKGGKFEVNHSDDFTDETSQVTILIGYMYEPPKVYNCSE